MGENVKKKCEIDFTRMYLIQFLTQTLHIILGNSAGCCQWNFFFQILLCRLHILQIRHYSSRMKLQYEIKGWMSIVSFICRLVKKMSIFYLQFYCIIFLVHDSAESVLCYYLIVINNCKYLRVIRHYRMASSSFLGKHLKNKKYFKLQIIEWGLPTVTTVCSWVLNKGV